MTTYDQTQFDAAQEAASKRMASLFVGTPRTVYTATGAITVANVATSLKADYTSNDAWEELGGAREQATFDMKMLALTDPAAYANARSTALGVVKTATAAAYENAYKQFHEAGYSREESKSMALRAASVTKGVQEQAMAKKFGGNDSLFMGASAREHAPTHVARTAKPKTARRRRKTRA